MHQPTLYTKNLVLRPVEPSDQQKVFEGFSHPEVIKHLGITYPTFEATAEQMAWYKNNRENGTGYAWVLTHAQHDFMGVFSIYYINTTHHRAELGYWLFPEFWGKGFAKEALHALLKHAATDLNIHRLAAEVEPENQASIALLQSCGFERDGILRDVEFKNGKFIHLEIWSIILATK